MIEVGHEQIAVFKIKNPVNKKLMQKFRFTEVHYTIVENIIKNNYNLICYVELVVGD